MQGFNLLETGKIIIALKKSNIYQLKDLHKLVNKEIQRRKKKESKGLKDVNIGKSKDTI